MKSSCQRPVFDHCYRSLASEKVYKSLAERGFILNPTPVRHPGRKVCQFLHFQSPAGDPIYLEFIHMDEAFSLESPDSEANFHAAGFALKVKDEWDAQVECLQRLYPHWIPQVEHRNYDWIGDSTSRLPGWNFLTFAKAPLKDIYTWLIQYEVRPEWTEEYRSRKREEYAALSQHANGSRKILGFLWDASSADNLFNMAQIARGLVKDESLELEGGTFIKGVTAMNPVAYHFRSKTSSFWAVVLGVEDLDVFITEARPDDIIEVYGRKAARIKLDDASWDLIAIDERTWSSSVSAPNSELLMPS